MIYASSSSSPWISLLVGGLVAILAFVLATVREHVRGKRDRERRQRLSVQGFVQEMSANRDAASSNLTLLASEQKDVAEKEIAALINPLSSLEIGAWPLARVDLPDWVLTDSDLVRRLQVANRITGDINALIASREIFRLHHLNQERLLNEGLSGYARIMIFSMGDLLQRIDEATRLISEADPAP